VGASGEELRRDHRVDDGVDQAERRVPGTELLARADHRRRLRAVALVLGATVRLGVPSAGRSSVGAVTTSASGGPTPASNGTSRYLDFDRQAWSELRAATPLTLAEPELERLRGINERIDLDEVASVYLPLSRLLNLYVSATQDLHRVSATFLGTIAPKVPYIIGIAGSVAVGKSTFARILQALLAQWPDHPKVDLITTDGFLYPNRVLDERGIMNRKGFPESYDTRALLQVLRQIKSGYDLVEAPVYSHVVYDIVPDEKVVVSGADIVIIEGLNVLQTRSGAPEFVSDYFDFSIYVDADEAQIEQWYVERFLALRASVFQDPDSFFRFYAELSDDEAVATARRIWREINGLNLRENIEPTRERASLIVHKTADHRVDRVQLLRL
jgi:type I pantothenate kinase